MAEATLLFDDDCGFCRWAVSKILTWDRAGNIRAVTLQSAEADDLLGGMDPETRYASWHLVEPDGTVRSAGDAVAPLMRLLPAGAPVALLARVAPSTTDRAYRWVARNRDRLGQAVGARACSVRPASR